MYLVMSVSVSAAGSAWGASPMHQTDDSFPYGQFTSMLISILAANSRKSAQLQNDMYFARAVQTYYWLTNVF
jgi:hypothetical protein